MLDMDPTRAPGASNGRGRFVLYLEGPGDRGILQAWCRRLLPSLATQVSGAAVILGGRQPARAVEHFRSLGGGSAGARGLCVLDRDDGTAPTPEVGAEPGLEFFTWRRRHIESYLLVPAAIRRGLRLSDGDGRLDRALRQHLPPEGDEEAYRDLDAKRILGPSGPLTRALGISIAPTRVARATRPSELHPDVHEFFSCLRRALGVTEAVVIR